MNEREKQKHVAGRKRFLSVMGSFHYGANSEVRRLVRKFADDPDAGLLEATLALDALRKVVKHYADEARETADKLEEHRRLQQGVGKYLYQAMQVAQLDAELGEDPNGLDRCGHVHSEAPELRCTKPAGHIGLHRCRKEEDA